MLITNIFFAAFLLMAYLAVFINPGDFILPAFFGLLYPYLLIINIIYAVIWSVNLRIYAFISVVAIILGFNHMSGFIRPSRPGNQGEPDFTLMSYNVRMFNRYEGPGSGTTEDEIKGLVTEFSPDILCIQEYYAGTGGDRLAAGFTEALGKNVESHIKLTGRGRGSYYGIATFSRFPVVNRGEIIHPNSSSLTIYTDIAIGPDTFRIFNNHLQSFRLRAMERSFVSEMIEGTEQRLAEARNVSMSLRDGFVKRAAQAVVLRAFIESSPHPVIVAGDFNDTPVSYSYRTIRKNLTDSFVKAGYGAGFTYKGKYPPNRIDYILHDDAIKALSFSVLRARHSDHYPVMGGFSMTN